MKIIRKFFRKDMKRHMLQAARFTLVIVALLLLPSIPYAATMNDYCVTPPFVVAGVQPNLLLMIDNSASMFDPIYISSTGTYCYDNTYNNANNYVGYFSKIDPVTQSISYPNYNYSLVTGKFTEAGAIPGSCTYGGSSTVTPYVCVNMAGSGATRNITQFIASGRFLNWLSASKLDVQKLVLTGGKYDTTNQVLIGESRGCVGRRFIRELPSLPGITFAVRGPNALEPDFANPETQGGLARIEIYEVNYNESACLEAVANWNVNLGQWTTAAQNCFAATSGNNPAGRESATFTESVRDCYQIKENINNGLTTPDTNGLFKNVTPNNLMTQCDNVYTKDCPNPDDIATCSILNDEKRGNYICSKTAVHAAPASPNYDALGSDTAGFVGRCWNGSAGKFTGNEACILREILHFCSGYSSAEVIDPSQGAGDTATTGNVPAIIMDAGVRAMGDPVIPAQSFCSNTITTICTQDIDCPANEKCSRFFNAKVSTTTPKGLIQEFAVDKNLIRFGAMSFNCIGSASETALKATCASGTNLDAGKIISYIGQGKCSVTIATTCQKDSDCPASEKCNFAGSHSSGLIKAIDDLQGNSWTPFSEAFYNAIGYYSQNAGMRINSGIGQEDFKTHAEDATIPDPIQYKCQRNNILLISDGMSTADQKDTVRTYVSNTIAPKEATYGSNNDGQVTTSASALYTDPPKYFGSRNLDDLAWYVHNFSIFDPTYNNFTADPTKRIQYAKDTVTTYVVYTGDPCPKDATGECTAATDESDAEKLMRETAKWGCGTTTGCYQRAENPMQLYTALKSAFQIIAAQASSGTAASVLASGEGSGANLIQAIFYPQRTIEGTTIQWTGSLQNFWYYIDPFLGNSTIREDTNGDKKLHLIYDYILHFKFPASSTDQNTVADLFVDSDGDGVANGAATPSTKYLDDFKDPANRISYLWEAGRKLWARPTTPSDRTIYTTTDGKETGKTTLPDTLSDGNPLTSLMNAVNGNEATAIARYVKGKDLSVCSVSKKICDAATPCALVDGTCTAYRNRTVTIGGTSNTWKLGDIVNSTPKISSWMPLNTYHKVYQDDTYGPIGEDPKLTDPVDNTHFISTAAYKGRGTVFVGGNDGMLHAFYLGTIQLFDEKYKKAELSGANLGKELWAYIPKHALPYLKYTADPNYCHIYLIDLVPNIFDASIGGNPGDAKTANSWRTILIGGMRFGGACKDAASTYGVQTPLSGNGYSSYFALDVTDPINPQVLWEFSNADLNAAELATGGLGFTTSGPAVVRVGPKGKNGNWFVVFGSGPTGPIDTDAHQFKGYSDQEVKLFIMDLKTGPSGGITVKKPNPTIPNAFTGSLIGSPIDLDQNNSAKAGFYQDDAVYFGYTKAEEDPITANTKWTKGGVLRLITKENTDAGQWDVTHIIDDIGPVTAAVSKLQNYKSGQEALWLYFGSGRYYYKIGQEIDDSASVRKIYGLKEPCFNNDPSNYPLKIDPACTKTINCPDGGLFCDLGDVTTTSANAKSDGWFITLDKCTKSDGTEVANCADPSVVFKAERMATDPLTTTIGAVFYTTSKPSADVCEFGGVSHLWAVYYKTGGALKKGILRGKALIQVSTGSVEEMDLSSAFTRTRSKDMGAAAGETVEFRSTEPIQGLSSNSPPQIAVPPKPMNRFIHIRER